MGGDEFGVLLMGDIAEEELCQKLDAFQSNISAILPTPEKVSCSIGACCSPLRRISKRFIRKPTGCFMPPSARAAPAM